ncbi:MAG: MoxR family ATPase [Myxococcaceae bacterium]|nr:MoxR family ATPase [Myxococcaceae bacterium]MCI0670018.1 MoxR family ATPase [Myxococcaceae bacterium]
MSQPARPLAPAFEPTRARAQMERVVHALERVILGKRPQVELAVTCLVAGGHLLLEDVPGVGKTTLAEALARAFRLSYARVQFTSDLMPADILGTQVFHAASATFTFRPGPLFHQLVLADELNRAPPRTQSSLLEAMAQGQVSLDGTSHPLPQPFTVVATQNPVDFSGTYPLPDSQLDRFLMRLSLGHPGPEWEAQLLIRGGGAGALTELVGSSSPEELLGLRALCAGVTVEESVADYAVRLAGATRTHGDIERGASTRAVMGLMAAARARALFEGRAFVTPGDLRALLVPCLAHRLLLRSAVQGAYSREEAAHVLEEVARRVPAPR